MYDDDGGGDDDADDDDDGDNDVKGWLTLPKACQRLTN